MYYELDYHKYTVTRRFIYGTKLKAAKERKSVAAIIREKLATPKTTEQESTQVLQMAKKLGEEIVHHHKELNLTKELIEMRYGQ